MAVAQEFQELAANAEPKMSAAALRGHLGGVDYYVISLTYASLARYVSPTDPFITDARFRENRTPSKARFREIAQYIIKNPQDYRFSALTCCYGRSGTEEPLGWAPATDSYPGNTIGILTLSQNDPLVIVDGQHRLGAIAQAIVEDPSLREENIPVVLFPYISIAHAQQLFSDLNRNAKKTTKSLDILFDHRDLVNTVVQQLVDLVPFFGERVNLEDISVPINSEQVFTLSGIYQSTKPVLEAFGAMGDLPVLNHESASQYATTLADFWTLLGNLFPEWEQVARGELSIREARNQYLHWNSGVLSAVGELAGWLIRHRHEEWRNLLERAISHSDNADWRRESPHWQGVATAGRQVLPRSSMRAQMIAYLKEKAAVELSLDEQTMLDRARSQAARESVGALRVPQVGSATST
jgi:DNA sulfur modification protein DndB